VGKEGKANKRRSVVTLENREGVLLLPKSRKILAGASLHSRLRVIIFEPVEKKRHKIKKPERRGRFKKTVWRGFQGKASLKKSD